MAFTRSRRALLALVVALAVVPAARAERQTGSIRGRITDKAGFPLPGAFLYVVSDSLLGRQNYITADSGDYAFMHLNPGTYRITVEMPGFKTVNVDRILVDAGKTVTLSVRLEATEIEEEITSQEAPPLIDGRSAVRSITLDADLVRHAPLGRDFASIVLLAPGVVPDSASSDRYFAVHGSTALADTAVVGGSIKTDPLTMGLFPAINVDTIDQVEFEAAARPAEIQTSEGGYINVITKSGGNARLGELRIFHSSGALAKELWTEAERADNAAALPAPTQRHWDFSLALGGPIMEDRAWYFSAFRVGLRSKAAPFASWTDPLGTAHDPYRWRDTEIMGFLKLTTQVTSAVSARLSVGYSNRREPVAETSLNALTPKAATRSLSNDGLLELNGAVTYRMNQDTFIDIVGSLLRHSSPYLLNTAAATLPSYSDAATGYSWGSADFNLATRARRFRGSGVATRFENGLGISHELRAGIDYEQTGGDLSTWKGNNLFMTYYDGSPYYFGTAVSPVSGNEVGQGLIGFYHAPMNEGNFILKNEMKRVGIFLQDSMTVAGRVTLNLGLRFDRSVGRLEGLSKGDSGNAISITLGNSIIKPVTGFNPYAAGTIPPWDSAFTWNALSPRAGLSADILGNGRTFLKASFARYFQYLDLGTIRRMSAVLPTGAHRFIWYDEDADGAVDASDSFGLYPEEPALFASTLGGKRLDPECKAPRTDEWTVGLHQELYRNLSVSLTYISKAQKNILETVLYDPEAGVEWSSPGAGDGAYWIPFETTVPGAAGYPDTPVTVYFRSASAPAVFEQLRNVPQLERRYRAFELTIRKRMSDNWQFYGSFVWGRATGNVGLSSTAATGFTPAAGTPNYYVNLTPDSRLDLDRPSAVRLLGTYRFPHDYFLTLYYWGRSGYPWARSVTIAPPDDWAAANGALAVPATVYLESPGTRRTKFEGSLDARLEKDIVFRSRKRLTLVVDVLNVLGHKTGILDLNDGGYWYPAAEASTDGRRVVSPTFEKYISLLGQRRFQFSLNLQF